MNLISQIFVAEILTTLTGVAAYLSWLAYLPDMNKNHPDLPYMTLRLVSLLFVFPVVYLLIQLTLESKYFNNNSIWKLNYQLTDKTENVFLGIAVLWLGWIVYALWKYRKQFLFLRDLNRTNMVVDNETVMEEFMYVKEKLKIHKKIELYRNDSISSPMLVGLFHTKVILPYRRYSRENLRIIFYHELTHYKSHDIFFRYCCIFAMMIQPFGLAKKVLPHLNEWSEHHCDSKVIKAMEADSGDSPGYYFDNIVEIMRAPVRVDDEDYVFTMLYEGKSKLDGRIDYMKKLKNSKNTKSAVSVFIAAALIFISSVPAYAAGTGLSKLNDFAYINTVNATEVAVTEQPEIMFLPAGEDAGYSEIVYPEDDGIMALYDQGSVYSETWSIGSGVRHVTSQMSMKKGQSVSISCTPSPTGVSYSYGIVDASGNQWYSSASGASSNTFPVPANGKYRVFVQNNGSKSITVAVSFSYN